MAINIGSPLTNPAYHRQDQLIAFTTTGDNNVPDGGTSAILLGLALGGLGVVRRLAKK
jgi:hypothetical protein